MGSNPPQGAGTVISELNDIEDITITSNSTGEVLRWNGTAWVNNTLDELDQGTVAVARLPTVTTAKGGTNLTTYTAGDILYASAGNTLGKLAKGTAGQALKMNSGATAPEWAEGGGGAHDAQDWNLQGSTPADPGTDVGRMYMKDIDANNEGFFMKIKKNGAVVEVQLL